MSNSVNTILVFFIMLLCGAFLTWRGILDEHASSKLTKIVLVICVPATMFNNVFTYFDPEMLTSAGKTLLVPFLTVFAAWCLGMLAGKLLRIPENRRGVFAVLFACSNTVFVGLPVNQALFGDAASVPALFYFLGNTVVFWTVGVWGIRRDAGVRSPFFSLETLKKMATPSLVTLIIALILLFLKVPIPAFLMQATSKLGAPGTPLAMIIAGGVIWRGIVRGTWKRREVIFTMAGKVLVTPLLAWGFASVLGVGGFLQQIFIAQAAMPVMSQSTIVAQNAGADDELASAATVVSMTSLLAIMPILTAIFG